MNCNTTADGWVTPTRDLGTFEVNCYYFGANSSFYWDHAYKQCVELGGRLAVIETSAEFAWIMQMYAANYSSIGGFFVDATRNRYGDPMKTPAWRGGIPLTATEGILYNKLLYTMNTTSCSCGTYYNPAFYLTASGNLKDIFETGKIPSNGGYLCKKYRTAPSPPTFGYNLGTCFPSLPAVAKCPSGWSQYNTSDSSAFCYQSLSLESLEGDEGLRQCHNIGADLMYVDSPPEYSWIYNTGLYSANATFNLYNVHRLRYGSAISFSNGQILNPDIFLGPGPNYWKPNEPLITCLNCGGSNCMGVFDGWRSLCCSTYSHVTTSTANGICKRPLCGISVPCLIFNNHCCQIVYLLK